MATAYPEDLLPTEADDDGASEPSSSGTDTR